MKTLATASLFVAIAIAATPAGATVAPNGTFSNGIALNALHLNGVKANALNMNGVKANALNLNGVMNNALNMNGIKTNALNLNGVVRAAIVEGDQNTLPAKPTVAGERHEVSFKLHSVTLADGARVTID